MGTIADKVKSLFNNPEKEKKKLEDEEKKINERIKTEIERSEIAQKRADIERKNDVIDDLTRFIKFRADNMGYIFFMFESERYSYESESNQKSR